MKMIVVDHGVMKKLIEEGFGTYPTIRAALWYKSDTRRARQIRQRALQLGGVMMEAERVRKEGASCI